MAFFILSDVYDLSEQVGIEPPRLAGRQLATISYPHHLFITFVHLCASFGDRAIR